jgi:hypothetical protein
MKLPSTKFIVFNAAAGLVTVVAVAGAVRSLLFSPSAAPCSERYASATRFSLERAGRPLAAAELQSALGGRDSGVLENLAVTRLSNGPAPVALSISLPAGSGSPLSTGERKGGVSFPWEPRSIQGNTAACLAYSVFLPADFDFYRGGKLPGIQGADVSDAMSNNFRARISWRAGGQGGAGSRVTSNGETQSAPVGLNGFSLPRGRWFKLEQEVILNTPKHADGTMRVWLDGNLVLERRDVLYRNDAKTAIAGVAADVYYDDGFGSNPKDASVLISPFELRWQ